jgi:endonuclease-3
VTGGTYTLLVALSEPTTVTFGAAGEYTLSAGAYAYVGSALGTGGFARVERHRELAAGERDTRHWHVDYLLGAPATSVVGDVRSPGDFECAVADALAEHTTPVAGLGASDCACRTHLFHAPRTDPADLRATVETVHERVG